MPMSRAPRTARAELPKGEQARHVPVLLAEVLAALSLDRPGLAVDGTFGAGGYTRALLEVAALRPAVDRFFTEVFVMVDDPALRQARLGLLAALRDTVRAIADLSAIAGPPA